MSELSQFMQLMAQAYAQLQAGGASPANAFPRGIPGLGQELTWTRFKSMVASGELDLSKLSVMRTGKETSLTVPTNTMYGCTGLFGLCGPDDILGLTMNDDPLIAWLGFFPDIRCELSVKGWIYTDVQGTAAGSPTGYVYGAPCDDPPVSEKGVCEFYQGDFGTLRACGEGVDVSSIGIRKCDKQPTYTVPIEGVGPVRIDNDLDLETIAGGQVVKHEVSREVITGDVNVAYQFNGLTNLVKTGYTSIKGERCTAMDSVVVDWSNDTLQGANNGHGSIITKVHDMWRRIRWRIAQTRLGMPVEGDVVLVMPTWLTYAFLDEWASWSFYAGAQYREANLDVLDMRRFRDEYARGLYNAGYITVDGFNIHILAHDWMPIDQSAPYFCSDIYMLVRNIGGRRVLFGQYVPAELGASAVNAEAGYRYYSIEPIQGGRGLKWMKFDNACVQPCMLFRPRLYLETPWAQGVIQNVCVSTQFTPMSLDPQSEYFIEDNLVAATSITQYWYDPDTGTWFQ